MSQATIQIDLDGLYTYRNYRGERDIDLNALDPVYTEALERFLARFDKHGIKATFFIVAQDALKPEQARLIKLIAENGHEIASHSLTHCAGFSSLPREKIEAEIRNSREILEKVCGKKINGFRAPTFDINARVLGLLSKAGYFYDASILPSFLNPVLLKIARSWLKKSFSWENTGDFRHGFAPRSGYQPNECRAWAKGRLDILEIPVSVLPGSRLPMHSSFVFMRGEKLFESGIKAYKRENKPLAYLFHGIDLLDLEKHNFTLPYFGLFKNRENIVARMIEKLRGEFDLVTTQVMARALKE